MRHTHAPRDSLRPTLRCNRGARVRRQVVKETPPAPRVSQISALLFLRVIPLPFLEAAYRPGHAAIYLLAGAFRACLIGVAALTLRRLLGR